MTYRVQKVHHPDTPLGPFTSVRKTSEEEGGHRQQLDQDGDWEARLGEVVYSETRGDHADKGQSVHGETVKNGLERT